MTLSKSVENLSELPFLICFYLKYFIFARRQCKRTTGAVCGKFDCMQLYKKSRKKQSDGQKFSIKIISFQCQTEKFCRLDFLPSCGTTETAQGENILNKNMYN
jgi:hypothetical protein